MNKEIIISSSTSQNHVAITEDGNLVDFFVDHPEKRRMVGDVFLGKVARVLPGIRAVFIDIGLKHDAFLHFSDIGDRTDALKNMLDEDEEADDGTDEEEAEPQTQDQTTAQTQPHEQKPVRDKDKHDHREQRQIPKLHKGESILIQIIKEPVKDKGR